MPRQPPGEPPTPKSVTRSHPGGDAFEPHRAALERQLTAPWGARDDKDHQLLVPLPDWKNWKRVRFWGVDHFVGFRYGDDHHLVSAGFLLDVDPNQKQTSRTCMRRFEAWALPQIRNYDVKFGPVREYERSWRGQPIVVQSVDGYVDWAFSRIQFSAAWASYPAYPDACLAYSVSAQWDGQPELAQSARDRWVDEAFAQIRPLTDTRPYRK